jgi:tetratricopeptide (TPR) repeat protein
LQNETDLKNLQDLVRITKDADTAFSANQFDMAIKHYKTAAEGYAQNFAQNHPDRLQCLKQLAECYWALQADQQAEALWSEVCGLLVTVDPFPAEKYVVAMFKLVKTLERQGKVPETEETYQLLVTEAERLLNPSHPLQLSIRQSQANFLRHLDKFDQARIVEDHIIAFQRTATEKPPEANPMPPAVKEVKALRHSAVKLDKSRKAKPAFISPDRILMAIIVLVAIAAGCWMLTHGMKLPIKLPKLPLHL